MPSNFTKNVGLCQWEPSDKVLRADFNADNAKIDALLGEAHRKAGVNLIKEVSVTEPVRSLSVSLADIDWDKYAFVIVYLLPYHERGETIKVFLPGGETSHMSSAHAGQYAKNRNAAWISFTPMFARQHFVEYSTHWLSLNMQKRLTFDYTQLNDLTMGILDDDESILMMPNTVIRVYGLGIL